MKNLISIITALFYSVSLYCANVVPQETPVKFEIHYSEKGVKAKNIPEGWSLQKDTFIYLLLVAQAFVICLHAESCQWQSSESCISG